MAGYGGSSPTQGREAKLNTNRLASASKQTSKKVPDLAEQLQLIRCMQSDVTELNWRGLDFDQLTNG